jgi:hypothetical protein
MIKKTLLALAIAAGLATTVSTKASAEPAHPPYGWRVHYGWVGPRVIVGPLPVYHRVWYPGYWALRPWGRVWIAGCWR